MPAERKLDVLEECRRLAENCELFVLAQTIEELKSMAARHTKKGIASRVALQLIEKNKIPTLAANAGKADEAMVELARKDRTIAFATNDAPLRRRLRDLHAKVICLKGESRMDWC